LYAKLTWLGHDVHNVLQVMASVALLSDVVYVVYVVTVVFGAGSPVKIFLWLHGAPVKNI
jgi:hypothetical protein